MIRSSGPFFAPNGALVAMMPHNWSSGQGSVLRFSLNRYNKATTAALSQFICHKNDEDDDAKKICKFVIEKCLKQAPSNTPPLPTH